MSSKVGTQRDRHVLPVALTPLLGRERELDETAGLLSRTRLLTITGAGGSGKTRLALELAHRMADEFHRAVWVDLAPISDDRLVAQQIIDTIGRRDLSVADDTERVLNAIGASRHLLIFDNCEHVVDGCAALAETLLRGSPTLTIIATTREPLGIAGEQTWLVPPLTESAGLELFVQRARAGCPSFKLDDATRAAASQICRRLDGIPLAIELAAARVRVLSVDQIAARLDDAFSLLTSGSRTLARHRTIREAIDWSFRLLSAAEQILLRRLAAFVGGFSLQAVEAVCASDGIDVLQQLGALVDKSLVVARGGRYQLLDTVRQFAAEKLSQSDEIDAIRERHARYYFQLVERSERRIYAGAVDLPTLTMIDEEIDNIRRAFDWAADDPSRTEIELRLIWALHWYWFARGQFHEARRRIAASLQRVTVETDAVVRARAFVAAGNAAAWQGEWKTLRPRIDDAVNILRPSNNLRALANALLLLGCAHAFAEGDHEAARQLFAQAEDVARRNGRNVALALTLYWAGVAAFVRNDFDAARRALEETYAIGVELKNLPATGHAATMLALGDLSQKRYAEGIHFLRTAFDVHTETADRWGLTQTIEGVGFALLDIGNPEAGTKLLAGASAAWLQLGARPGRTNAFELAKDERIRRAVEHERLRVVLASGAAMPYQEMVTLASEELLRLEQGQGPARPTVSPPAPRLRVRALGPLEIELRGDRLAAGVQSARARELLLYLLCHPAGATKEEIGAALWPEADPAKVRNNFHVTVHRLRKMLDGPEWIIAEGDLYSLDRSADLEFDAERFERDVKRALRAGDTNALQQSLMLYRGDFCATGGSGEWDLPIRDRLRDLHLEALRTVGRAMMMTGDFRSAAEVYQRLIDADSLDEQAYRNLITCLGRQGDVETAARVYRRLVETLRRELDTEPDPATTRLLRTFQDAPAS